MFLQNTNDIRVKALFYAIILPTQKLDIIICKFFAGKVLWIDIFMHHQPFSILLKVSRMP